QPTTKMNAAAPIAAYRNQSDGPSITCSTGNERLTRKFAVQLAAVEIPAARARARLGKISEIISHTTGPSEKAKHTIYSPMNPTVIGASVRGSTPIVEPKRWAKPRAARLSVIPVRPANSSGFLPTRSTSQIAISVDNTL